jgi:hypothetical protein
MIFKHRSYLNRRMIGPLLAAGHRVVLFDQVLSAVCCLLSAVCCLMSAACCLLSAVQQCNNSVTTV